MIWLNLAIVVVVYWDWFASRPWKAFFVALASAVMSTGSWGWAWAADAALWTIVFAARTYRPKEQA